jgi:Fe-S oxidoreductase
MSATLEKGLNALREQIDAPIASYFSSCVHCGMCAEACLFFTETRDPKYTPIHKLEPMRRLWEQEYTLAGRVKKWLGLAKPITDEELEAWSPLVYDSCTQCGRCSMVCPVGNDLTYMICKLREGMALSGHAPPDVVSAVNRTVTLGSPMGVKLKALQAQIRDQEAETGLTVPIDVQEADYLALLSSMEIMNFPEYIGSLARIFDRAGVSWTLSSEAFEATNSGIQIGQADLAGAIVMRIVTAAEKLGVKSVISPECGHAYTALRWEGPNLIGRPYRFEVVHILELLEQLRREGRLKTRGKEAVPLTFHDPCQLVRRGGVVAQPRRLLGMIAEDFREMDEYGVWNWCCGGGGGVSASERANALQLTAFRRKQAQLEKLNVETMVTACANCRIVLEEGLEHHHMDIKVVGLTELVAGHLES